MRCTAYGCTVKPVCLVRFFVGTEARRYAYCEKDALMLIANLEANLVWKWAERGFRIEPLEKGDTAP